MGMENNAKDKRLVVAAEDERSQRNLLAVLVLDEISAAPFLDCKLLDQTNLRIF